MYHESGSKHQQSGLKLSESLNDVVKAFQDDPKISEPISKVCFLLNTEGQTAGSFFKLNRKINIQLIYAIEIFHMH